MSSDYPLNRIELIIIDDCSTDGTFDFIRDFLTKYGRVKWMIIRTKRELFSAKCRNIGIMLAKGKYLLFADDDNVIHRKMLTSMVSFLEANSSVGIVGPVICYLNNSDTIWCAGMKVYRILAIARCFAKGKSQITLRRPIKCDAIPSIFMTRCECTSTIKFNESLSIVNDDIDFCLRVKDLGYEVVVIPWAITWHDKPKVKYTFEAFKLKNPKLTYFFARNRLLICATMNKKRIARLLSYCFSYIVNILRFLLVIFVTRNKMIIHEYFRGIIDGIRIVLRHELMG